MHDLAYNVYYSNGILSTQHCVPRSRRVVDQQLREDQDAAYQESLAADREKERRKQQVLEKEAAQARLAEEKLEEEQRQKEVRRDIH